MPIMLIILLALVIIATAVGTVNVPFLQVVKIILKQLGIWKSVSVDENFSYIIFYIRLPRVLVAVLVGAALSTSGAVMQGMFRNPMADPGIIGVSSGASLGAVIAIALGLSTASFFFLPLFASAGALLVAFVIFVLSVRGGKVPVLTLVLSGIAVSMFVGAVSSVILTIINHEQVSQFVFWNMGGLNNSMWEHVKIAAIPIAACVIIMLAFSRDLNLLLIGEEESHSVGLNPSRTRKILLFLATVATATAVSVSGNISFVGLIVPHILRLMLGPDHRILLPASAVGGAIFLVICDLIARTILIPREIAVGIITSLLGAPYFLFLLIRAKKGANVL